LANEAGWSVIFDKIPVACYTTQEAQLPPRDHAIHCVSKFVPCFMMYGS